jgi:hypothetical protein
VIRFRFTEDERRYLQLLSEAYRIIASKVPPALVSRVMRSVGKLEQMAYLEGVRQGLAIAELSLRLEERGRQSVRDLKAFQAHAILYGSTDTPMREVELEWLEKIGLPENTAATAWLDDEPLRYAPQTLAEWEGEESTPEAAPAPHFSNLQDLDPDLRRHFQPDAPDAPDEPPFELPPGIKPEGADDPQERPAMLDQLRDVLSELNPKPETWQDLILHTHRVTGIDAGFLDLQLSSDMGSAVLAQCGIHIHPGLGFNLQELQERQEQELSPAPPPETEQDDGGAA